MNNKTNPVYLQVLVKANWFFGWICDCNRITPFYLCLVHILQFTGLLLSNDFAIWECIVITILSGWLFFILSLPLVFVLYLFMYINYNISEWLLKQIEKERKVIFMRYTKNNVHSPMLKTTIDPSEESDNNQYQLIKGILIGIGLAFFLGIGN